MATRPVAEGASITITGTIKEFSPSVRLITLDTPIEGLDKAALTAETRITFANGGSASIEDLRPGAVVQIAGRPGSNGALVADRIVIIRQPA